jgi:hypothetical protein
MNTGTWTSRLGGSHIWDIRIIVMSPARSSRNCKLQTRHTSTNPQLINDKKNWLWVPDGCLAPRYAKRLSTIRNTALAWSNLQLEAVENRQSPMIILAGALGRRLEGSQWWPPLWSSGQSSWLQIQRPRFDSRRCHILWEVVGLERGPLNSWAHSRS